LNPFVKGELELFNGLSEHARLTLKSLNIIEDALRSGDLVRIKEAEVEVGVIENQGDEISRVLSQEVSTGAIATPIMGDVEILIGKVDDILDKVHILSREIRRAMSMCASPEVKKVLAEDVIELIMVDKRGVEEFIELASAIARGDDWGKVRNHVLVISKLEDEVDEAKDRLIDKLYELAKEITYVEFMSLLHIVFTLDDVIDITKDAAYLTSTILMSLGA
jgi:predicted phosphate transport protein (TIGR00153 family)